MAWLACQRRFTACLGCGTLLPSWMEQCPECGEDQDPVRDDANDAAWPRPLAPTQELTK